MYRTVIKITMQNDKNDKDDINYHWHLLLSALSLL